VSTGRSLTDSRTSATVVIRSEEGDIIVTYDVGNSMVLAAINIKASTTCKKEPVLDVAGVESLYVSITTTIQEQLEAFCAKTATRQSDSSTTVPTQQPD
jgi:hypothetical protein